MSAVLRRPHIDAQRLLVQILDESFSLIKSNVKLFGQS